MINPVVVHAPTTDPLPLVLDSPHSGNRYPDDFGSIQPVTVLRQGEDAFVDELFDAAPGIGATLVAAQFPRSYIDPNRSLEDIDPADLSGAWDGPVNPGPKTEQGIGLVWTKVLGLDPMYDRKLTATELRNRIDRYYTPYHQAVAAAVTNAEMGAKDLWHINCHSMPSVINRPPYNGFATPEICLGDRDGTTCDPAFRDVIAEAMRRHGYEVTINDPYKGVELVRKYGQPDQGRHSIQIEINRKLYMDEASFQRIPDFDRLRAALTDMLRDVAAFIRAGR